MEEKRGSNKQIFKLIFSVSLIALAGWVFINRQGLQDQLVLARYDAPAAIQALASGADLSERGKDLFFVNLPELRNKDTFSNVCNGLGDEQSNVLGCFNGTRIYIYDVPDKRLEGVEEVTAAHEMLHAAYMRLSGAERERVDGLIQKQLDAYTEPYVRELISVYNRLEPGELLNEMHSILATEQRKLSPDLEQYFAQYFNDRGTVVGLSDEYREVFDSLKREQETLAAEIDQLAGQINSATVELNRRVNDYNAAVEAFNNRARSGDMTAEEFDQERAQLEAERTAIGRAIEAGSASRRTYDQKRQEFESLLVEFAKLQNTLDSTPAEPEGV